MTKYKVKNFKNNKSEVVQGLIKNWLESRKHISIVSINVWSSGNMTYSTIVYTQNHYVL